MICRLCLKDLSNEFVSIFKDDGEIIEATLLENIVKYLELELKFDDLISNKICEECWKQLDDFHKFYLSVQKNQSVLQADLENKLVTIDEINHKQENDLQDDILFNETSFDVLADKVVLQRKRSRKAKERSCPKKRFSKRLKAPEAEELIDAKNEDFEKTEETSLEDPSMDFFSETEFIRDSTSDSSCLEESKTKTRRKPSKKLKESFDELTKNIREGSDDVDKFIREHIDLICHICNEKMATFSLLKQHSRKKHNCDGFVKCCNSHFKKRYLLFNHINVHNNPNYFKCQLCDKVLTSQNSFNNHMDTLHPPESKLIYECSKCPQKFTKKYILDAHVSAYHGEDQQLQCETCNKIFRTWCSLRQHISNTHLKVSKIVCDLCGLVLRTKQNLDYHMIAKHNVGGNEQQQIQCSICGNWLKNEKSLQKHMYIHNDEASAKEFTCSICGEVKQTRVKLASHIRYHHSDNKFKCSLCEKVLKSKITLKEHIATHTGTDLYSCPFCEKTFKSHANMHNHKKKIHPEKLNLKNNSHSDKQIKSN